MPLEVRALTGSEIAGALQDLARLRIEVFRAWPYLYDGDATYEQRYLRGYADDPAATLIAARDGDRIVGASSGLPLEAHGDARHLTLPDGTPDRGKIYYCAESVLLPEYRGQGVGGRFFDLREEAARRAGFSATLFAAVIRADDDPRRPANYRSLEPFWHKRGYMPLTGASLSIAWKDIDMPDETGKDLAVWIRPL